jgi:hypothetical protein
VVLDLLSSIVRRPSRSLSALESLAPALADEGYSRSMDIRVGCGGVNIRVVRRWRSRRKGEQCLGASAY